MIYVITYQLNSLKGDQDVIAEIQGCQYWINSGISNVWFVATGELAEPLYSRLRARLTPADYIFVSEITVNDQENYWLPRNVVEWLTQARQTGWVR